MKLKLLSLLLCSALFSISAFAQSLSPTVISSSGAFYANGVAMLSTTVGEMTMVETFSKPSNILTQGFQQPEDFGVYVAPIKSADGFLQVSPNPGSGMFLLSFSSPTASKIDVTVFDEAGRSIMKKQFEKSAVSADFRLDLNNLAAGYYFLNCVASSANGENQQTIYHKVSLIK